MNSPAILIVEDDLDKINAIRSAIIGVNEITHDQISVRSTINDARQALLHQTFDILVLDLNLPSEAGAAATPTSGLVLLKQVNSSSRYKRPRHVIFLSEYSQEIEKLKSEHVGRSWHSIHYSRSSSSWSEELVQKIEYVLSSEKQRSESEMKDVKLGLSDRAACLLVILYQIVCVGVLYGSFKLTEEIQNPRLLDVPLIIWQWSLCGSVGGILYDLGLKKKIAPEVGTMPLYVWAFAKPFVGTLLGAVIYILALCGVLILNGKPEINNNALLCAISFLAAFSDKFSMQVIEKVTTAARSAEQN